MRNFVRVGLALVACALLCPLAVAQAPQEVKAASVKLHARGQGDPILAAVGMRGQWDNSFATGVLISEDGLILTAYHLIGKLGPIVPDSLDITATPDFAGGGQSQKAWVLDANPYFDLLLLKMQHQKTYSYLPLGSAFSLGPDAELHTYGYPATGQGDVTDSSKITSKTAVGGYMWGTTFSFAEGQSGSPVFDNQNRVVAIAKGALTGSQGMIVPIDYADTLLAYLRFREQRQEIANLRGALTEIKGEGWLADPDHDLDLGVAETEGICFLVGVNGWFDNSADKVWVDVVDGIYKLRGKNDGVLGHGATARCVKYGRMQ